MNHLNDRNPLHSRRIGRIALLLLLAVASATAQEDPSGFMQTNGPTGGTFRNLVVAPNGDLFTGYVTGGIFRSQDGGETWEEIPGTPIEMGRIYNLYAHENGSLFALASETSPSQVWDIWRSVDNGETWARILDSIGISSMTVGPDDDVYVVDIGTGIQRSRDNGETWDTVDTEATEHVMEVAPDGTLVLLGSYPSDGIQVFRSTDRGDSWSPWGDQLTGGFSWQTESRPFLVAPSGDIYLGVSRSVGVLRLDATERTWREANGGIPPNASVFDFHALGGDTIVAVGDIGVMFTIDKGETWEPVGAFVVNAEIRAIVANDDGALIISTPLGFFTYDRAAEAWELTSDGVIRSTVITLASGADATYAAATGLFRTVDHGATWDLVPVPLTTSETVWTIGTGADGLVLVGANSYTNGPHGNLVATKGSVYRSTDNGTEWVESNTGLNATNLNAFTVEEQIIYVATDSGLYSSIDDGASWRLRTNGLPAPRVLSAATAANGDILVGTLSSGIWRSNDGGESWTESNVGYTNPRGFDIAVAPGGTIVALGGNNTTAFRSTDHGLSWEPMENGLPTVGDFWSVEAAPNGTIVISGNDWGIDEGYGVWSSTDDGLSWRILDTVPSLPRSSSIDSSGYVFLGMQTHGVWRSALALISGVVTNGRSAEGLDLSISGQGDAPLLSFTLGVSASLLIEIYDAEGARHARQLIARERGTHTIALPTSSLPSGWYAVRVATGESEAILPFIIMQ